VSRLSEDDLIATLFAPIAGPGGFGLRDDAAIVAHAPDEELVVTVDALVSGVHFFPDDPPDAIAAKALGVNLSDLAAKAAQPTGFLLSLALPANWTAEWLEVFARGLREEADRQACPLLGGDTVKTTGPLTLSVTAFGTVPRGRMLPRTGARPGDAIYVSGTIGDSALGLQLLLPHDTGSLGAVLAAGLDAELQEALRQRYLRPQPRLALRAALQAHADGGMDVSDGLVGDVTKMLKASGTAGRVDLSCIPLSDAGRKATALDARALSIVVTGGDDYEILAAIPRARASEFEKMAERAGVPVTRIGNVLDGTTAPVFHDAEGRTVTFDRGSFSHF
jgi:thiamine-monophosphate kinase